MKAASKPRVVYTITAMSGDPHKKGDYRQADWGYFFKREDAERVVERNETDISELGYYRYALLAAKGEGPLAIAEPLQWYEFIWQYRGLAPAKYVSHYGRDEVLSGEDCWLVQVKKIRQPKVYDHTF